MSETSGVGGADQGGVGGAGGVGGVGGADRAGESRGLSGGDRAEVSGAAASASASDVSAQADAVAGPAGDEDGFDRAEAKEVAAADAAAPGGAAASGPRAPSEGTMAERERREVEAAKTARERDPRNIDAAADKLAAASPTARGLIESFRAAGGTFQATNGGGWFDQKNMAIHVPEGPIENRMRTIAHELGHFDYRNNPDAGYVAPGRPTGATDRQIEHRRQAEYITENVNRRLADEGNATLINAKIRDEVLAATGKDITVSGFQGTRVPTSGGTLAEQRRTIGDYFGSNLQTSTTSENYRSYYGRAYIEHYERNHLPGVER